MSGRRRTVVRTLREGWSASALPNDLIIAAGEQTGDTDLFLIATWPMSRVIPKMSACRLWVQTRHFDRALLTSGPPRTATFSGSVGMSQKCQERSSSGALQEIRHPRQVPFDFDFAARHRAVMGRKQLPGLR